MIGLLMMLAGPTIAFVSGNELTAQCVSADRQQQSHCSGYITGAMDGISISETISTPGTHSFCVPAIANPTQIVDVVKNYIRNNPAQRSRTASAIVYLALREAFPCKNR